MLWFQTPSPPQHLGSGDGGDIIDDTENKEDCNEDECASFGGTCTVFPDGTFRCNCNIICDAVRLEESLIFFIPLPSKVDSPPNFNSLALSDKSCTISIPKGNS